jgi:hypothetical protein
MATFIYLLQMETETTNFHLCAANKNGKLKFIFLGWQTINDN